MQRSTTWLLFLPLMVSALPLPQDPAPAQPRCYQPGEIIAPDIYVYDGAGRKRRLLDLAAPETKVIYLLLFGGPTFNPDRSQGGLWCADTFNDMPISNYLYLKYRERGVTFMPVACPPIYHARAFGYPGNQLLSLPEGRPEWHAALAAFVNATQALQNNHVIPFEEIYFDPKFRLLFNYDRLADLPPLPEKAPGWTGKFKPCDDRQCYSTPTIWLLSRSGEVLHEPFAGNRYAPAEQRLRFTAREIENVLLQALRLAPMSVTTSENAHTRASDLE
ncbi:MAG: hypothetical protein ACREOO_02540 [bacterium]